MDYTNLSIYLGILVFSLNSVRGSDEDDRIRMIYAKCQEETQIDDNEMETFHRMELPSTPEGKCMMGCLMRETYIIVEGRFYKDGALEVAERYYYDRYEDLEKAKMVIDICEQIVANEYGECEVAARLAECIITEAQNIGLTSIPHQE